MKGFTLASVAIHDLDEIYEYVASDSPAAADGVIDGVEAGCQLVADHPHVGRPREEIEHDVMSFPLGSYLIFFRIGDDDSVEIARVPHDRTWCCIELWLSQIRDPSDASRPHGSPRRQTDYCTPKT